MTKVGKGTKRMLVVDGNGIPLALSISRASKAEVKLAQETLERVRVPRRSRKGRRKWADEYKKRWRWRGRSLGSATSGGRWSAGRGWP